MIVCPNCSHQNPDGAIQCEACYTPLPSMVSCPTCGASVQSDASFCGQCGANLSVVPSAPSSLAESTSAPSTAATPDVSVPSAAQREPAESLASVDIPDVTVPDLVEFDPLMDPEPLTADVPDLGVDLGVSTPDEMTTSSEIGSLEGGTPVPPSLSSEPLESNVLGTSPVSPTPNAAEPVASPETFNTTNTTQIQTQSIQLIHTHSNAVLEVPPHLAIIHIGKPNDRVPPDIDVSGFKDSEVVSRVHADIRVEGDSYYIEDVGSSNGTYVNNIPLASGNRHKLRSGDRIALGKGDKVSFIIQIS